MTPGTDEPWEQPPSDPTLEAIATLSESENLRPYRYDISLSLGEQSLALSAQVDLEVEVVNALACFPMLLCEQLELCELLIDGQRVRTERRRDVVWVRLKSPLTEGQRLHLRCSYSGRLPRAYVGREESGVWVELSPTGFWYPLVAWRWDLSLLIPFRVECRFPKGFEAFANVDLLAGHRDLRETRWVWVSKEGEPLIAVLAGPYGVRRAKVQGLELLCAGRQDVVAQLDDTMREAADLATYYAERYGPTAMRTMQVVIPPHSVAGNWGLGNLIVGAQIPADDPGRRLAILSHEVAHIWWGQSVRFDFSTELWLAEGLTEFSAMRARLALAGETAILAGLREWTIPRYEEAREARVPLADCRPDSPHSDAIRENASAIFLSLLRVRLGNEEFDVRLRRFYHTFRGERATTADFVAAMTVGQPEEVLRFVYGWVHDSDRPEVTVEQVLAGLR